MEPLGQVRHAREIVRTATQKHKIEPRVLVKEAKAKTKKQNAESFRAAIWTRDGGKCRATKKRLEKASMDDRIAGEVDHVIQRSLSPERIYDVQNGILISRFLNRLKKAGRFRITGPDDRGLPQLFEWLNADGSVLKWRAEAGYLGTLPAKQESV